MIIGDKGFCDVCNRKISYKELIRFRFKHFDDSLYVGGVRHFTICRKCVNKFKEFDYK